MSTVRKAVIPAAGMGTRFLPASKSIPKELLPLTDRPVIQHIVEEAVASGITDIIFVTAPHKDAIQHYFERDAELEALLEAKGKMEQLEAVRRLPELANFSYVTQDEPLGLGHAVLQAEAAVADEPFVVFGADDVVEAEVPAAQQLIDVYREHNGPVVGVMEVPQDAVSRYGIIDPAESLPNGAFQLNDVVEKPAVDEAPSRYASAGRWLLTPDIFELLHTTQPGAGGEIQLTDALRALVQQRPSYAKEYDGVYWDCGNKVEYTKAVVALGLKHPDIGPELRNYLKSL